MSPRFRLGQILATPAALRALQDANLPAAEFLQRHIHEDWGDVDAADWAANDRARTKGRRLLSAYLLPGSQIRLWIITEADRSATTLLLPEEY